MALDISGKKTESFKDMFNLVKGGDKTAGFYENKFSYLDAPSTYGVEPVTPNNMHPYNYMDKFKGIKNIETMNGYRDNTIIINDYHTQEVGQYAKPKKEINYLFEPVENLNALAGDTKILDKIGLNRYSDTLKYKQNEYIENTRVRPELIDGVPMTELVRAREKNLEQLRGKGINSQRLDPNARLNETGFTGEGVPIAPQEINITKYKMKSYREQNSVDDLLKTTGQITRPEWRSSVKEPSTDRSFMKNMDGPAMATVMKTEYHNEDAARPTIKEETINNNYISNPVSVGGQVEYRNMQSAKPTLRTEYESNDQQAINPVSFVGGQEYRNEQTFRPTIREEYANDQQILNANSYVPSQEYRNEQSFRPTIREQYANDQQVLNVGSYVPNQEYRNEQSANPTIRAQYESNDQQILNPKPLIENFTYRNEQSANPTIRTEYSSNDQQVLNPKPIIERFTYRNEQSANPTIRTEYSSNDQQVLNPKPIVERFTYRNEQSANPTIRTEYSSNDQQVLNPKPIIERFTYRNEQSANPTIRSQYESNDQQVLNTHSFVSRQTYHNEQSANPTIRAQYESNDQ